jgi:HEAT repeat protein
MLRVRGLVVEQGSYPVLVEALLEGLRHASPGVRYDCAHALDHLADERCALPLRHLLDDPVPRVRRMALHVLSCDACKLIPLQAAEDLLDRVIDHALTDPSINVRRHATAALGNFCADRRAARALETLLAQETDPALLRQARRSLRHQTGASGDGDHHLSQATRRISPVTPGQGTGD